MTDGPAHHAPRGTRRELVLYVAAAVIGPTVGSVLVGGIIVPLLWRAAALSLALALVVVAMMRVVALGGSEWRRESPPRREYLWVVGRFALAFVLVLAGSS